MSISPPRPPAESASVRLDALADALRDSNPFKGSRVSEPSPYDVDVEAIHQKEFDRLRKLSALALKDGRGVGVALLGGAGVGKSHLLSRLYRWANRRDEKARGAVYVFLHNLLADPDRLPRYLLKCVVSLLSEGGRRPLHETELFALIQAAAMRAIHRSAPEARRGSFTQAESAYREAHGGPDDDRVIRVLFALARHAWAGRHAEANAEVDRAQARSALAWLSGEEIDAEAAEKLGLKAPEGGSACLRDDQEIEQVFLHLARMAGHCGRPLILCLDQVENLGPEKIRPLSVFLHALLDHAENLLVIVSGVKESLLHFRDERIIPEAAWDRVAEYRVEINRVPRDAARQILEARLVRFFEPFEDLDPVRRRLQQDTLFPLGRAWFEKEAADGREFKPRQVLMWARDAWDDRIAQLDEMDLSSWLARWSDKPDAEESARSRRPEIPLDQAIDAAVDRKLQEHVAQRRLHPGSLPPDAGNLAGLVESLLEHCEGQACGYTFRGVERRAKVGGKLPTYDLHVREEHDDHPGEITTGVAFVTNTGRSATASLRRLLNDDTPPDHRILVTDEERRPLTIGATGQEYYDELVGLGPDRFEHIKLDFERYVALDALEAVVGLARVGDLEVEHPRGIIRTVTEAEVIASLHRQDRYRRHPLLRPLLTEEPPEPSSGEVRIQLDEPDFRQHIMAQLAWRLGMTAHEVAHGYLKGRPNVVMSADVALEQVKAIASRMHNEGLIYVTPNDDDLFLQRRS